MGKLDVGVGDDFPVDEPPPPSPETEETVRAAREEWQRQKEEWRQRKSEWRAQRHAFREDMRTRGRAFKDDVKRSFHENFGDRPGRWGGRFAARFLIVLGAMALVIALLPFLFMFGFLALAAALFFAAFVRGRHSDFPPGRPSA
jgi:Flp pilus assembly protein TadB